MGSASSASNKTQVNVRLSDIALNIMYALQEHWGLSQSGVFELLLRNAARDEGLDIRNPRSLADSSRGKPKTR